MLYNNSSGVWTRFGHIFDKRQKIYVGYYEKNIVEFLLLVSLFNYTYAYF